MKAYKKMVLLVSSLAVVGLTGCPAAPVSLETINYCGSIFRGVGQDGKPAKLSDPTGNRTYTAVYTFQVSENNIIHVASLPPAQVIGGVACSSIPFPGYLEGKDFDVKTVAVVVTDDSGNKIGAADETDGHGGLNDDKTVYSRSGNYTLPGSSTSTAAPSSNDPNSGGTPTTSGAVSRILNFFRKDKVASQAPVTDRKAKLLREQGPDREAEHSSANAAI